MTDPLAEAIAHFDSILGIPYYHRTIGGNTRRHAKTLVEAARAMQPADDLVEALTDAVSSVMIAETHRCEMRVAVLVARAVIPIAQAPVLAQLADERRKSEALAQHLANVLDTGHSYESEGMARDAATKALAAHSGETT